MHKILYLKFVLATTFILAFISIGYTAWKSLDNNNNSKYLSNISVDTQNSHNEPIITNNSTILKTDTSNWQTYRNEEYGFGFKLPQQFFVVNASGGIPISEELIYICGREDCGNETPSVILMADPSFLHLSEDQVFEQIFSSLHNNANFNQKILRKLNNYLIIQQDFEDGSSGVLISDGLRKIILQSSFPRRSDILIEGIIQTVIFY